MRSGRKVKVSLTLSPDVVERLDRAVAEGKGRTRSGVADSWLRRVARDEADLRLREETLAYYAAQSQGEREEDEAWAEFAASVFPPDDEPPDEPHR